MNWELITSELWVDYKIMDESSCEWTPFIMSLCSILGISDIFLGPSDDFFYKIELCFFEMGLSSNQHIP